MASPTPAPAIPSASDLAALDPAVAITLLVVVGLGILGFYLGPGLAARLTRSSPPSSVPAAESGGGRPEPPTEAVGRTTQQFIDHLLASIAADRVRIDDLERRLAARDREIDDLQLQIHRLQIWQHGRPG